MNPFITSVDAFEILDSRGQPTLTVTVKLENGMLGSACVPSGASTGEAEARELRDEDPNRYGGRGVLKAAENVRTEISDCLTGKNVTDQGEIDRLMIELDGTPDKSRLGANAIVGASMAAARAGAAFMKLPLYRYLGGIEATRLPVPMMNVINGGKHAHNRLEFQEFMIVPHGAPNFAEALRWGAEVFAALRGLLQRRGYSTGVGDEGGFAPELKADREACELIVQAIELAGYRPGADVAIALDPAATSFYREGLYDLPTFTDRPISSAELLDLYNEWLAQFPIVSIEDGFAETDWAPFRQQTAQVGGRIQIVGDDLYVTNTRFIGRGIRERSTNAVLIKLNQIGTVTETIAAIELCRKADWRFVVSHRSGETEDPFIADFTVAMGGGQIKTGSLCRSERIAKYNRLLAIERELGQIAEFESPFHGSALHPYPSLQTGRMA
jgi:enolase